MTSHACWLEQVARKQKVAQELIKMLRFVVLRFARNSEVGPKIGEVDASDRERLEPDAVTQESGDLERGDAQNLSCLVRQERTRM